MTSTEWRPVVGFERHYQVSEDGRVRSIEREILRKNGMGMSVMSREMRQQTFHGYLMVTLHDGGRGYKFFVHRLVAAAFIGPAPPSQEVCHNDGDRTHNRLTNLRYGSRSDNVRDAISHGTYRSGWKTQGEQRASAKLTDESVRAIRDNSGESSAALALRFGVSRALISNVRRRLAWTHV